MKQRRLLLVAGHNRRNWFTWTRRDPGVVLRDKSGKEIMNEHYLAELTAYPAFEQLKSEGYDVLICPFDLSLKKKIRWCNNNANYGDVILSVHFNASTSNKATGTEVWHFNDADSRLRASRIACILSRTLKLKNRGRKNQAKKKWYRNGRIIGTGMGIVKYTKAQSFLLELGFMTNPSDYISAKNFGVQAVIDSAKYLLDGKN
jgi:N-acetylmuramoyl-L-alanine amidase